MLNAGADLLCGSEVVADVLAAKVGPAVEVVEVAVVGGGVEDGGRLGARACGNLTLVCLGRRELKVEEVVVVRCLAGEALCVDLRRAALDQRVVPCVVRVHPSTLAVQTCRDLVHRVCAGPVHRRGHLTACVHTKGRSRAGVLRSRHGKRRTAQNRCTHHICG